MPKNSPARAASREEQYKRRERRDPSTYSLPQMLSIAISTNRPEMCETFANQLLAGLIQAPEDETIADMARLIGDLLEDRAIEMLKLQELKVQARNARKQAEAFEMAVETVLGTTNGEDDDEFSLDLNDVQAAFMRRFKGGTKSVFIYADERKAVKMLVRYGLVVADENEAHVTESGMAIVKRMD